MIFGVVLLLVTNYYPNDEDTLELNICGFVGGREGESELCINSWFCVLLTHFYLLFQLFIYTYRTDCWLEGKLIGGWR